MSPPVLDPQIQAVLEEQAAAGVQPPGAVTVDELRAPMRVTVKIRNRHEPAATVISPEGEAVRVEFDAAQRAITPGQAAVFYDGDVVVGGGWIG